MPYARRASPTASDQLVGVQRLNAVLASIIAAALCWRHWPPIGDFSSAENASNTAKSYRSAPLRAQRLKNDH